jgi:hypothetical protein
MRIPRRDRDLLRWAAILHDVGKLEVPATLLNKPGKPTAGEWAVLKAHPTRGAEMAAGLLPWLGEWADVIMQHHERYDGTGYPDGVGTTPAWRLDRGRRRRLRRHDRPATGAWSATLPRELVKLSGTQFDPVVVRAMVAAGAPCLRVQGANSARGHLDCRLRHGPAPTVVRPGRGRGDRRRHGRDDDGGPEPAARPGRPVTTYGPNAGLTTDCAQDRTGRGGRRAHLAGRGIANAAESALGDVGAANPLLREVGMPLLELDGPHVPAPRQGTLIESVGSVIKAGTDAVGSVTKTVSDAVADPVGTVDDAVSDTVGTVQEGLGTATGSVLPLSGH